MYQQGGIYIITSRILIVDLLTQTASPASISGILVYHAEKVTETSTESFIIRIYKTQKLFASQGQSSGFVKGFSEDASEVIQGFGNVDKILKGLFVRRLYLYPRFHVDIVEELEKYPPKVDELHQQLTPLMKEIQGALAAAVQACIRQLKSSTNLIEWTDDLTVENCVTNNFDRSISRQLEHDWHRLKPQTKNLVYDLRTIRTLFQYLLQYDSIAFWKLLNNVKTMSAASRTPSMWLLTPAADLLFRKAKDRVYKLSMGRRSATATTEENRPALVGKLTPVLEENPKWRLLKQVLTEVRRDWKEKKKQQQGKENIAKNAGGARVLVMTKDNRTLETLRSYLVEGKDRTMMLRWLNYLERYNDRSRTVTKGAGHISEESRLLIEEEGRVRNFLFGTGRRKRNQRQAAVTNTTTNGGKKRQQANAEPDWKRKKRKVAAERGRGQKTLQSDDLKQRAILDEALEETEHDLTNSDKYYRVELIGEEDGDEDEMESSDSSSDDEDELAYKVNELDDLRIVIRTYPSVDGERASLLLRDLMPDYVILYDADISFIRSIEIHSLSLDGDINNPSMCKHDQLRVFFMLFEASSEEKNFLKSLEREQNSFERLIAHKKSMPLPVNTIGMTSTQEMQQASRGIAGSYAGGTLPLSVDTRTGRGKGRKDKERRDIAVDVREFRSALPSILHQGGMRLAPVTLTVGDFVLSSVHCVERKSISDLFGSFASGRLYTQAEAMSKHYKCPCLLIEFDPGKSFSLLNSNELGGEIRGDSICSKMALLTMHFPKLRLLWSRGPHETLKIFKALKQNHDEVDVDKAIEIGSNESLDALLGSNEEIDGEENEINEAARDMLLRLPGININNARKIMNVCDSIAELADMPRDQLRALLGPATGQKIFTFFRQKFAAS
mmetsp:Transcript_31104/g.41503  ORF Transcript_31104/g.41503 Transcript_31104/m.41503 type:complete len:897 (-) Transcript_31104:112-2802(-)